ncbi:MAG: tRNA 4-thiouridine(8) synthase ThiI, partial [Actinomycetota bacterium]
MERLLMLKIAGEIGTKSARTRRRFLRVLTQNVRAALRRRGLRAEVEPRWSRLLVRAEELPVAREALARVFGLHSVSEVSVVAFGSLDELVSTAAEVYRDRVVGRTFAVR